MTRTEKQRHRTSRTSINPAPSRDFRRIDSIDLLRGLVIVLMGLDHVRDFFGPTPFSPENLDRASVGLFLTRWVTHFCAPVFVLLAGLGAALYESRGRSRREVAGFLLTRGAFLIVLELTVVNLSWLSFFTGYVFVQVIWVIGWSMILLAGAIYLPRPAILVLSLAVVAGHNTLDPVTASTFGAWAPLWAVLHQFFWIPLGDSFGILVIYPLIPWLALMPLGYLLGAVYRMEEAKRRSLLLRIGLAAMAAYVILRWINLYGDPSPWAPEGRSVVFQVLSFLNTTKYPASLLFLLMTLGPALALLPYLEGRGGRLKDFFVTFGRVPLFFYVLHLPVIHLLAAAYSKARYDMVGWYLSGGQAAPPEYEPNLFLVYGMWISVTLLLYPACRWYAGLKRRSRHPIFSYL